MYKIGKAEHVRSKATLFIQVTSPINQCVCLSPTVTKNDVFMHILPECYPDNGQRYLLVDPQSIQ